MKYSITNLLLVVSVIGLIAFVLTERNTHQRQIAELETSHEAELMGLEVALSSEFNAQHILDLGRWIDDDEVRWHWNTLALMGVWHLHVDEDAINGRPNLIDQYGSDPASKMAGELLAMLECDSFDHFAARYRKMEKTFRFTPNPITISDAPEQIKMIEFVNEALEENISK